MEFYMFEIDLCHLKHIVAIGQEDVTALLVLCHELILAFLERLQLGLIVAFNPASLVEAHRLPTTFGIILILQPVLDDLKLKLSDRSDKLTVVPLIDEKLRHALAHKLVDALGKLLRLHGVVVLDILEHLG